MRVIVAGEKTLHFEQPRRVVRSEGARDASRVWDEAERELSNGSWIAGYFTYERDVLVLGVYGEPHEISLPVIESGPATAPLHSPLVRRLSRERYAESFDRIARGIDDGDVYQVNLTIPFDFVVPDALALWAHYAARTGARYQAYVEDGDRAILSWSPELFLGFSGDAIRTKPMKGTAALDRVDELTNEKNLAEHVMIVDLLRNDLHRISGDVRLESFCEREAYPTFVTMTSTIAARIESDSRLAGIFEATFPCGSVTGAPKRAAMRFIRECEPDSRGAYCGTIGFLSPERRGWWNVSIRTAQVDLTTRLGRYDAGGGIVADSDAGDEWNEIQIKRLFLETDAELLETFASNAEEETVRAHLCRLEKSAEALGVTLDLAAARRAVEQRCDDGPRRLVRLRVNPAGKVDAHHEPLESPRSPVRVCVSDLRVHSADPLLRHKTSWRPVHDAAARAAKERGHFEALLRNERDELTEGARTTLFVRVDDELRTPPLSAGVLPGILRARMLASGRAVERTVSTGDLRRAGAIYVGNSARGLLRATIVR